MRQTRRRINPLFLRAFQYDAAVGRFPLPARNFVYPAKIRGFLPIQPLPIGNSAEFQAAASAGASWKWTSLTWPSSCSTSAVQLVDRDGVQVTQTFKCGDFVVPNPSIRCWRRPKTLQFHGANLTRWQRWHDRNVANSFLTAGSGGDFRAHLF
jgi:uncharacterized protein YfiM (DUF2279 family)